MDKGKLLAIVLIVAALLTALGAWLTYDAVRPAPVEVTPTPSPTPLEDMSPGQTVLTRLTDEDPSNDGITDSPGRNAFLQKLASQIGSTGEIIGAFSSYTYYSEWYIRGYEGKDDWNKDTPWCACYISWALEQVSLSLSGPPPFFAEVDYFMASFDERHWLTQDSTPIPGDLIFFGSDGDPDHVGVVIAVQGGSVYTIEGNTAGIVGIRRYAQTDPRILGYAILNWNQ